MFRAKPKVTSVTFKDFCKRFLTQVDSPTFGEPPRSAPAQGTTKESPAYRELHTDGIIDCLCEKSILRAIYDLILEHDRLESERLRARPFEKGLRRPIQDSRYAQKRLAGISADIKEDFLPKYKTILGNELVSEVHLILDRIEDIRHSLRQREKVSVSRIPPSARRKGDEPSGFDLVLKDVDYDLDKITTKAAEQWLYTELDEFLKQFRSAKRNVPLSQMTRMKLISAIVYACGIGSVPSATIKEFLRSQEQSRH